LVSGWAISENGQVRNTTTGRVLSPCDNGRGYLLVGKYINGKKKNFYVHRLVAEAFLTKGAGKTEVNHINGDKRDNRAQNLEWCTSSENKIHAFRTGLRAISDRQKEAAKRVCLKNIPRMRDGWEIWARTEAARDQFRKNLSSADNRRPVEEIDDEGKIVRMFDSLSSAALHIGVDVSSVSKVCRGKNRTIKGHVFRYRTIQ